MPAASPRDPRLTSARFSPTSGTTSATVARATRSRSARVAGGRAGVPETLQRGSCRAFGDPAPAAPRNAQPTSRPPRYRTAQQTDTRRCAGCRIGQSGRLVARLMVIGNDDFHTELLAASATSSTAVIPQSTVRSTRVPRSASLLTLLLAQPIPISHPIRNQPVALSPKLAQRPDQQRRSADPVDVEVTVHGDPPPAPRSHPAPARRPRPSTETPPARATRRQRERLAPPLACGTHAGPGQSQPARSAPAQPRAPAPPRRSTARLCKRVQGLHHASRLWTAPRTGNSPLL